MIYVSEIFLEAKNLPQVKYRKNAGFFWKKSLNKLLFQATF